MKKRLLSMTMVLLFIASLPISAFAESYDLAIGGVTVEARDDGNQYVSQTNGVSNEVQTTETVVYQTPSAETGESAPTSNTVTINAAEGQTANVTLKDVNIDVSKTGDTWTAGDAAVSTTGKGNVNIELDGNNSLSSGQARAGLEKNNEGSLVINDQDNDGKLTAAGGQWGAGIGSADAACADEKTVSNITINGGNIEAQGGTLGAGIGGGSSGSAADITINGGEVKAVGGVFGAGIGGGAYGGTCSNVTVSGDASVKAQGGIGNNQNEYQGAAIGDGGNSRHYNENEGQNGAPLTPNTDKLTKNGTVALYAPGVNMDTAEPEQVITGSYDPPAAEETESQTTGRTVSQAADRTMRLYRVVDKDIKDIDYNTAVKDGVLTITADVDYAALTGTVANISILAMQGIKTVVFVTSDEASTFDLADLSAKGSGTYMLTGDGAMVTFTLGTTDISEILK